MKKLILLITLLTIGCNYKYDTRVANENNILKNLLMINISNTNISNRTENVIVTNGNGTTTTTTTTTTTGTNTVTTTTPVTNGATVGVYGSAPISAKNFYLEVYNMSANSSFFSYSEADKICSDRGMKIVSQSEIKEFAKIIIATRNSTATATQAAFDLWKAVSNGYFRFWIRDIDSGLADNTVAYYYDTDPNSTAYLKYVSIYNKSNKWMSVLCFK